MLPRLLLILWTSLVFVTACSTTAPKTAEARAAGQLKAQARLDHQVYRSLGGWRKNTYRNKALLDQATLDNTTVQISLREQRGFLLVRGAIAMDFPVATGKASHPTPAGTFPILFKAEDYHSNLYGKIYDAEERIVTTDGDVRIDPVPPGGRFEGATMPFWMRLTQSGVGLHVGYVPGHPASHGCVRLPRDVAGEVFQIVKIGTPVTIAPEAPALLGS